MTTAYRTAGRARLMGLCVLAALLAAGPATAEIVLADVWVRATAGTGKITAGYGTIRNTGANADALVSVSTPAAGMTHIHKATHADGIMRMSPVGSLDIPAGGEAVLAPGNGHHLMLMNVARPLKAGDTVEVTFTFRDAGAITATAAVRPLATPGAHQDAHQGHQ